MVWWWAMSGRAARAAGAAGDGEARVRVRAYIHSSLFNTRSTPPHPGRLNAENTTRHRLPTHVLLGPDVSHASPSAVVPANVVSDE